MSYPAAVGNQRRITNQCAGCYRLESQAGQPPHPRSRPARRSESSTCGPTAPICHGWHTARRSNGRRGRSRPVGNPRARHCS